MLILKKTCNLSAVNGVYISEGVIKDKKVCLYFSHIVNIGMKKFSTFF